MIQDIFDKVDRNTPLSQEDGLELLALDPHGADFYALIAKANELSRREYRNRGYVFVQIGLNSAPCSGNCQFCSLAKSNYAVQAEVEKSLEDVVREVRALRPFAFDALFLMTTADYDQEQFLAVGAAVRRELPADMDLVANVGDFHLAYAQRLKEVGFTAVYHIVRLREGEATDLPVAQRIGTLDAIREAGLKLFYCVEPIGPEHTAEELVAEMLRAREYHVDVMAVMRRVPVPGTPFAGGGQLSELEMTRVAAAARLVTRPRTSMNVHEPMKMPLLAGVNQLYAETGVNPRDTQADTEQGRGYSLEGVRQMLRAAEYEV